jgi:hypothetical protein
MNEENTVPEYEVMASYVYYGVVGLFSLVLLLLAMFHVALPAAGYGLVWDTKTGVAYVLQQGTFTVGDTLVAQDENGVFRSGMLEGVTRQAGYSVYRITNAEGYSAMVSGRYVFGVAVLGVPVVGVFLGILAHPVGSAFLLWGPLAMVVAYVLVRRYAVLRVIRKEPQRTKENNPQTSSDFESTPETTKKTVLSKPRAGLFFTEDAASSENEH